MFLTWIKRLRLSQSNQTVWLSSKPKESVQIQVILVQIPVILVKAPVNVVQITMLKNEEKKFETKVVHDRKIWIQSPSESQQV